MVLAIANGYGNVDLTKTALDGRYRHVSGKRLQPLCRALGIKYAEAVVGWTGSGRYGYKPLMDGVVVSAKALPKLLAAIQARRMRNPPEKLEQARRRREERRLARLEAAGINDPNSYTAKWFERGEIDALEAQLIQFKVQYRHLFTDYDSVVEQLRSEARQYKGEIRKMAMEDVQRDAREMCSEEPIPDKWEEYLATYCFPFPEIALRLSQVLKSCEQAHPVWFCEAVLALKRTDQCLDDLTYEAIRDAIEDWRNDRMADA